MATKITSRVLADDAIVRATLGDDAIGVAEIADDAVTTAAIADDVGLGGNPTTTTQSTANSTTRIATTAFVQAAIDTDISALIDSAPGTLNTLNEIAAALNDDPSFTTTVNNAIALKAPIANAVFTGNSTFDSPTLYVDGANNRVGVGTTSPSSLLHLSASSYPKIILNDETGVDRAFSLGTSNETFVIRNETASSDAISVDQNNKVGIGAASPSTKLEIASTSGSSSLRLTSTNTSMSQGATIGALEFYNSDADSPRVTAEIRAVAPHTYGYDGALAFYTSYTTGTRAERMRIDSSGNVGIGTTSPGALLEIQGATNSETFEHLTLRSTVDGNPSRVNMFFESGQGQLAKIEAEQRAGGSDAYGHLAFWTANAGTMTQAMTVNYDGKVGIGTQTPDSILHIYEDDSSAGNTQLHIENDKTDDAAVLRIEGKRTSANDTAQILFANNNNLISAIKAYSAADDGDIRFYTSATSSGDTLSERMKIDPAGAVTMAGTLGVTGAITGTLATAAQTAITSVGTLTTLAVGAITSGTVAPSANNVYSVGSTSNYYTQGYITNVNTTTFNNGTVNHSANQIQSGYDQNSDNTDLWINYTGYQSGTTYFRDFRVGNGKQSQLLFVDGSAGTVAVTNGLTVGGTLGVTGAITGASVTTGNSNLGSNSSHLANLTVNNNGYIGSANDSTALNFTTAGDLVATGKVGIGTAVNTSPTVPLQVNGAIKFNQFSAGHGLNTVTYLSFNNSNTANACGSVYYANFIINIYHNNGHSQCYFCANGGGGVGYNFTGIVPGNTALITGTGINTSFTTIGSSPNTFQIQISSGGGALTVSRSSGSGSFAVSVHKIAGG
jgi:hypothetical protein